MRQRRAPSIACPHPERGLDQVDRRQQLPADAEPPLHVAAVLAYANAIRCDPLGFPTYDVWEASLPAGA